MKKFLTSSLFLTLSLSACSNNIEAPIMPVNEQTTVDAQSKNGIFEKIDYSLVSYKTNTSKTYVQGIVVTIKPLIGQGQTDREFKFVNDKVSNMVEELHGSLLIGKNNMVYFVPRKSSKYDPITPSLDKEFLNGQAYTCYKMGEYMTPSKENNFKIVSLTPAYDIRLTKSAKRQDYLLTDTNKEMEIYQKNGKLFVTSNLKISDFKTK